MVGKLQTKNIYVETDYDNIILLDPNKLENPEGGYVQRLVDAEDLVYYANLETKIIPRTKLAIGEGLEVVNTTVASFIGGDEDLKINFLKPKGKNAFDTSWSDQLTGDKTRQFLGANQTVESITENADGNPKINRKVSNYEDTQTLLIKSIGVKITPAGAPTATIKLVDIQGRTLFEQGENSMYSVFFNLPYPTFYLTLKGYYGKAIRYQLALTSFNAKFDQSTGNFDIDLTLIGRPSALLFDTILSYAKNAPKMFKTEYYITEKTATSNQTGTGAENTKKVSTSLGRQKLEEVYEIYKNKGLIPQNFPVLSIEDFLYRSEGFETWAKQELEKPDFQLLTDVSRFRTDLNNLRTQVYDNSKSIFLDLTNVFYINEKIYYPFKPNIDKQNRINYKTQVTSAINIYKKALSENKTFGSGGSYKIEGETKKTNSEINVQVDPKNIIVTYDVKNNLTETDFKNTFYLRTGKLADTNSDEYNKFKANIIGSIAATTFEFDSTTNTFVEIIPEFFVFGDKTNNSDNYASGSFLETIQKALSQLKSYEQDIEEKLTNVLAKALTSSEKGLGFSPTIRNVFAVIIAGCDAFYRMLDETHTKAWNQRKSPERLNAIISADKGFGVDSKRTIQTANILNDENIVYPWPQYFEKETQQDGRDLYVLKYPGDPSSVQFTKGNNKTVWPEIEFTEQFLYATTVKTTLVNNGSYTNPKVTTKKVTPNAIEFPFKNSSYTDTTDAALFFEILERAYLNSHYGNLIRQSGKDFQIDLLISDLEAENIKESITNNFTIIDILKNTKFNGANFKQYLQQNFRTYWSQYENDIFITPYIKDEVENDYGIYSLDSIGNASLIVDGSNDLIVNLKNYLNDTRTNEMSFLNTYPFTDLNWIKTELANGTTILSIEDANQTTKSFTVSDNKKIISRLEKNSYDNVLKLFVDNYGVNNGGQPYISVPTSNNLISNTSNREQLKQYYQDRSISNLFVTETIFNYGNSYSGNVGTSIQTTSLLNTPYFINSLINGVEKEKLGLENPYVAMGYLYLNSLPLITTREKIKTFNSANAATDLDYLAATLTKFSAIHQLPYAWVLKYGSIWHRYKKWIENGEDILSDTDVWKNINYTDLYDPETGLTDKEYFYINFTGGTNSLVLQKQVNYPAPQANKVNQFFNVGFYPKAINNLYYYFSKEDLFNDYTPGSVTGVCINKNLVIGNNKSASLFLPLSADTTNPNRSFSLNNFYQYMDITNNGDFNGYDDSYLLFPSFGGLPFNQAIFECLNNNNNVTKELLNNTSFYNGSIRTFWSAANFGYFDHSLVKKPTPEEYLKVINPNSQTQSSFNIIDTTSTYSSIEEIFSVFSPDILDSFERKFLEFCDPNTTPESLILEGEIYKTTYTNASKINNIDQKILKNQMKGLFFVNKLDLDLTNENSAGINLSKKQSNTFTSAVREFLNFDCILKIGNPGNFNRIIFDSFSENAFFSPPNNTITFGNYGNELPPEFNFLNSFATYSDAWATLRKYVGFSKIEGLAYTQTGCTVTDFFKEMNVQFTSENIKRLYPLIRLYGTKSLGVGLNLTRSQFKNEYIANFLAQLTGFQNDLLNETFTYLRSNLPTIKKEENQSNSTMSGNVAKLETYNTLKGFNDKWISGSELQNRLLFEDFLFLDRANGDIGNSFTLTLDNIVPYLKLKDSTTIMDIISKILSDNHFMFFPMPAYVNFYGIQSALQNNQAIPSEIPNSMFGTFLNVDYIDSQPKFVCTYVGKPSEHLQSQSNFNRFNDDSFDLRNSTNNPIRIPSEKINPNTSNRVVGFNVDFGIQNQNIFKDLSLDMSEKKNTAESFKVISSLANSVSGDKVAQQSQSLYSIYKTRSYTCGVDCLGNVMIQPTMYFNLRYVPLFYGPYFISEVSHDVDSKDFKTSFKGIRMPLYSLPKPDGFLSSVNKNLLEKYKQEVLKNAVQNAPVTSGAVVTQIETNVNNTPLKTTEEKCLDKVNAEYASIPFEDQNDTVTTNAELKTKIETLVLNQMLGSYTYGSARININNRIADPSITCDNYNLFTIQTSNKYPGSLSTFITKQVCISILNIPTPIISFDTFENSILFYTALNQNYFAPNSTIFQIYNILRPIRSGENQTVLGESMAYLYSSTWEANFGKGKTGQQIIDLVNSKLNNSSLKVAFAGYINNFISAVKKFNVTI